jgi:hypothetical protein
VVEAERKAFAAKMLIKGSRALSTQLWLHKVIFRRAHEEIFRLGEIVPPKGRRGPEWPEFADICIPDVAIPILGTISQEKS